MKNLKMSLFLIQLLFILILVGCKTNDLDIIQINSTSNPAAEEILTGNPNANIFMYSDIIYNAGVSWVDELELTKDQFMLEIVKNADHGKDFVNGTANKLKVETKIYSVKERGDILIAETNDGDIRFYKLVEG
ncbi:hypothetical protein [Paenibacillus segetis]|uniref:Uncharacterized protein n=1 Tax=Paenibacillus segetis TaxID=1325360 RepID=A0ABQ1YBS0_9BACL|nr:hypothetical protein [Paenibacillus segetis]GGH20190.1 hypothetical protein GCM10008013_17390 [Paenibacillus segetis]